MSNPLAARNLMVETMTKSTPLGLPVPITMAGVLWRDSLVVGMVEFDEFGILIGWPGRGYRFVLHCDHDDS